MAAAAPVDNQTDKRENSVRFVVGIALSALSGVMLLLSYPPYGLWPLMWIGFIPMFIAQYRLMPRKWSSVAVAIANLVWLGPFLRRIFGVDAPWFYAYLGPLIALLNFFTRKERIFHEQTKYRWFALQGVLDAVGFEMIRSFIPVLGTMGFLANSQASQAWLIQPNSLFSIYGLSAMIMFVNLGLGQEILVLFDKKWQWKDIVTVPKTTNRRWLIGVGAGMVLWVGISLIMLTGASKDSPTVRVAALQSNFPAPAQFDEENEEARLLLLDQQVREATGKGAKLIFTAEMAFGFDPQQKYTDELKSLAAETGTHIFISYAYWEGDDYHNEAVLLSPSGEFGQIYGKNHPAGEPRIISAGSYPVNDTTIGKLATIICMDANFTDSSRLLSRKGAQLIAAPTYDATPGIAEQMWTHAVMRTVENRVAMVKTGHMYGSAIIDPYGRLVNNKVTIDGEQLILIDDVLLGTANTLVMKIPDWLGWVSLAGFVFFMFYMEREKKKQKQTSEKMSDTTATE